MRIICLANSYKHNGRCIASIDDAGRWVRPVSSSRKRAIDKETRRNDDRNCATAKKLTFLLLNRSAARPHLPSPYTQRICVPGYWPVNTLETERINHSAAIKFAFYAFRRHQSVIFSLNPVSHTRRMAKMSRDEIRRHALQLAERWQALLGTNGINTKADLTRYLGVSRPRVTQVLKRLKNLGKCEKYLK